MPMLPCKGINEMQIQTQTQMQLQMQMQMPFECVLWTANRLFVQICANVSFVISESYADAQSMTDSRKVFLPHVIGLYFCAFEIVN